MLESKLKTYLLEKTAVTDLVGTRYYPLRFPTGHATWPAIAYQRMSYQGQRQYDLSEQVTRVVVPVQFTIVGTTYESVKTVAEALRNVLSGFSGLFDDMPVENVEHQDEMEDVLVGEEKSVQDLYFVVVEYQITYQEGAPTLS